MVKLRQPLPSTALVGAMLLPNCGCAVRRDVVAPDRAVRRDVVAPDPARVRSIVHEQTNWFDLATNIRRPSDLRPFEPIIDEIAGERSVPIERVFFVSNDELRRQCSPDAGGCYISADQKIYLGESHFTPGRTESTEMYRFNTGPSFMTDYCDRPDPSSVTLDPKSRFWVYLHEQGHHFDRYLSPKTLGRWIDQTEAETFAFYAAMHIARHYDRRLGLDLILTKLIDRFGSLEPEYFSMPARILIEKTTLDFDPSDEKLADMSQIILLGSGLNSFGEVWYYIHSHTEEDVAQRIRANVQHASLGMRKVNDLVKEISDPTFVVPEAFETFSFQDFTLSHFIETEYKNDDLPFFFGTDGNLRVVYTSSTIGTSKPERERLLKVSRITDRTTRKIDPLFALNWKSPSQFAFIDYGNPTKVLSLPNGDIGAISVYKNPFDLPTCIIDSRDIIVDESQYLGLARGVFERIIARLEHDGKTKEAEFFRSQVREIFPQ
jgi:hypothetical protein